MQLNEASLQPESAELPFAPAIVFGPPQTADFNGEEHFD
jgi:hypothetical protein